jgi:hypothetical protein
MPFTHTIFPDPRRCMRREETVDTRVRRPERQCADCAHSQNTQRPWYGGTSEYGTSTGDSRSARTRTGAGYVVRLSSRVHKVIYTFNLPDDVQKFERAITSGKPFKTESTSRRLDKRRGSNADNADDSSGPGSESESADPEPPKIVSCNSILVPLILIFVRIMHGEVSWHSYRTRAPTTNDFYIPRISLFVSCLLRVSLVPSHPPIASKYPKSC